MPDPAPTPFSQPDPGHAVSTERGWKVVLLNDDVTPFDVVVLALQRSCGLSEEVAEMIAVEAHTEGSAIARRGLDEDSASATCDRLRSLTRIVNVCPGVGCHHERED